MPLGSGGNAAVLVAADRVEVVQVARVVLRHRVAAARAHGEAEGASGAKLHVVLVGDAEQAAHRRQVLVVRIRLCRLYNERLSELKENVCLFGIKSA